MDIHMPSQQLRRSRGSYSRSRRRRRMLWLGVFVALLSFFGWYLFQDNQRVEMIRIVSLSGTPHQDIELTIREHLDSEIFGITDRAWLWMLSNERIVDLLYENHSDISDVTVSLQGQLLVISFSSQELSAVVCEQDRCFLANQQGVLYQGINYIEGDLVPFIYVDQQYPYSLFVGQNMSDFFPYPSYIQWYQDLKDTYSMNIETIVIDQYNDLEVRFSSLLGRSLLQTAVLKVQVNDDFEEVKRKFDLVFSSDDFQKTFKRDHIYLQEIDIRFEDRIFYTFTPTESQVQ